MKDPGRWLDGSSGDDEIRQLLEASRKVGPSVADKAAVASRLGISTGPLWLTPTIKAFIAGGALVAGGLALRATLSEAPSVSEQEQPAASTQPAAAPAPPSSASIEAAPNAAEAPPAQAEDSDASASHEVPAPQAKDAAKTPPQTASARPPSEARLLSSARAALESKPEHSLSLLKEHRRLYPRGVLSPERDLLEVKALRAVGAREEAEARRREFEKQHPNSVHHVEP